jgi:hypothetical protein
MASATSRSPLKLLALAGGALVLGYVAAGIYVAGLDQTGPPPNTGAVVFHQGCARGERLTGRSWTACYGSIVTSANQTVLDLDDVTDGIIFKNKKPYLKVRAKHMTVNALTHDFAASGKIDIETADPKAIHRTFETDAATWSDATQRLVLPHKSTIYSGAELPLTVGNLTLDVKSGEVQMNSVAGAVRIK